jgi:hypothetical protein
MEGRRKKSRVNTEKEKGKKKWVMDDGFSSSFTDITLFFFFLYDVLIGKPWYLSLVYLVETLLSSLLCRLLWRVLRRVAWALLSSKFGVKGIPPVLKPSFWFCWDWFFLLQTTQSFHATLNYTRVATCKPWERNSLYLSCNGSIAP